MAEQINSRNQIFISYRREDSAGEAGRIYDRLVLEFGGESVFKDIDSIPLGINFKKHIDSVIRECDVVLVIIGQKWAGMKDGQPRLNNPRDLVRLEIESALQRAIPIIPVFVNNASIESEESLPPSLVELLDRNGITIGHDPHFHPDMNRLIKDLRRAFEPLPETKIFKTIPEKQPQSSPPPPPPQAEPQSSTGKAKKEPVKPETKKEIKEEIKEKPKKEVVKAEVKEANSSKLGFLSGYSDNLSDFSDHLSKYRKKIPDDEASTLIATISAACGMFVGVGIALIFAYYFISDDDILAFLILVIFIVLGAIAGFLIGRKISRQKEED